MFSFRKFRVFSLAVVHIRQRELVQLSKYDRFFLETTLNLRNSDMRWLSWRRAVSRAVLAAGVLRLFQKPSNPSGLGLRLSVENLRNAGLFHVSRIRSPRPVRNKIRFFQNSRWRGGDRPLSPPSPTPESLRRPLGETSNRPACTITVLP